MANAAPLTAAEHPMTDLPWTAVDNGMWRMTDIVAVSDTPAGTMTVVVAASLHEQDADFILACIRERDELRAKLAAHRNKTN